MSRTGSLYRNFRTLVKCNGNQIWDYMTNKPARLAGIPGGSFPSNHACKAARQMNQARNRTVGNTLFMRTASPVHVINPLQ